MSQDTPKNNAETRRRKRVDDAIEDAMRPYLKVLPPEALATMREILEETLATHHVARTALDAMEAEGVDQSGTVGTRDEDGSAKGKGEA